ncbi:MAG TPA: type II toxin-antitoxin system RelE/ParE family toxin [Beijerinckiaceae bacterium]|jgi:hypothetical protein
MAKKLDGPRVFKAKVFARDASKARISDDELCEAIREVMQGKCDDLGGEVFKKRLRDNDHRSIILAKGGELWIYQYLFAKADRKNIRPDELKYFKTLAKAYARLDEGQIAELVRGRDLTEICHDG